VDDQKIVDLRCVAPEVERKEPGANKAPECFANVKNPSPKSDVVKPPKKGAFRYS